MNKLLITCVSAFLLILLIGTVCAEEITIKVDSKHIEGMGTGATPFGDFVNVVYIISEMKEDNCGNFYILQEYPITMEDYCKIKTNNIVTLEVPSSDTDPFKVVKIN